MIEVRNISYSVDTFTLKNISFTIEKGDYFTIIGPSGAGKTVIIEILAGLITPQSGQILKNGEDITTQSIQKRLFPVVFQDYALFPNLTAYKNIEFGLKGGDIPKSKRKEIVTQTALELGIAHLLKRHPNTLSGGEQQRVAIARALACKPDLLILDEPLASIDESAKDELVKLLKHLNALGTTIVHITHHYEEALILSNKIAMINQGEMIQWGATEDVFCHPKHPFVARFMGYKNVFSVAFSSTQTPQAILKEAPIVFEIAEKLEGNGFVYLSEEDVFISLAPFESSVRNCFSGVISALYIQNEKALITVNIGIEIQAKIALKSAKLLELSSEKSVYVSFKATAIKSIITYANC